MPQPLTCPCPKCNRVLTQSGTVTVEGQEMPAFQCPECLRNVTPFRDGVEFEVALTFCLLDGQVFDPSSPDGVLRW